MELSVKIFVKVQENAMIINPLKYILRYNFQTNYAL